MSRYSSIALVLAALLPLCFAFVACDSSGSSGGDINNEFSLTIDPVSSGNSVEVAQSQPRSLNGFSFFYDAENPQTGEQAFAIYLNDAESFSSRNAQSGLFGIIGRASSRPGTGTYQLARGSDLLASEFTGVLWEDIENYQEGAPLYVFESGTLTLDESSGNKVAGSIDARATELRFTSSGVEEQTVSIEGQFTAKDAETFVPFSGPGI